MTYSNVYAFLSSVNVHFLMFDAFVHLEMSLIEQ